jgi:hypothetical protein
VAATVLSQLKPGSIVVMHFHGAPNAPMTAPAVRQIIQGVRARGLEFGTVSEVLARVPPPAPPPDARSVLATMRSLPLAPPGVPGAALALVQLRSRTLAQRPGPFQSLGESLLA